MNIPEFKGQLRHNVIEVPRCIQSASGIRIFGRLIKSLIFTTDVAIIRNNNADAVIAVYPFTPQPSITHAIMTAAEAPVLCGVGGGTTTGRRVVNLAMDAEFRGAFGVVVNAPTVNETVARLRERLDIPIVVTVAGAGDDIQARLDAGADILNISAAAHTPDIVAEIRGRFPDIPLIATGGPTDESIERTIAAGANAVTYTPPTSADLFRGMMAKYRERDYL
ncbi:MAG: hydrolase [Oscillospiraceae bacterium]|nr:hydrolase [Oscillospiraceae bacterium]